MIFSTKKIADFQNLLSFSVKTIDRSQSDLIPNLEFLIKTFKQFQICSNQIFITYCKYLVLKFSNFSTQ